MQIDSLVSVVITSYNYARYVAKALESVLDQTYKNIEIIVVNDGSTDDTDDIISPYLVNQNIRYIKQGNAGQANAKNRGIREAQGEFVAFLDADDIWEPTKLAEQMKLFVRDKVGVVFSSFSQIDEHDNAVHLFTNLTMHRGNVTEQLFIDNFVCFPSSIVRKKCLDAVGGFDESLAMGIDWDLWLRISITYEFDYVDEPLVRYRVGHAGQMSKNMETRYECAERIMKKILAMYPDKISNVIQRKAWAYTWQNRARYWLRQGKSAKALYFLSRSIKSEPFSMANTKIIIKILLGKCNK